MKTFFFIICISFSLHAVSQISWVPTERMVFEPAEFYATKDGGFIALEKKYKVLSGRNWNRYRYALSLLKYDKDMHLVKEQPLQNTTGDFSGLYASLKISGNKFLVICMDPAEENMVGNVKAIEIDPITLQTGAVKTIASQSQVSMELRLLGGLEVKKIFFESSPDFKKHFLFIANGREDFYLACLDEHLETISKGRHSLTDFQEKDLKPIVIDNDGNIFITGTGKTDAFLSMYDATGKGTYKNIFPGTEHAGNSQLYVSKTGQVFIGGTYSESTDYAEGVYTATINKTNLTLGNISREVFPDSILKRLKKDGYTKNHGIFNAYVRCGLWGREGDKLSLVIECKSDLGDGGRRLIDAGSLVIANFDAAGTKFSHIPRYAVAAGVKTDDYYYGVPCKQQLFLFYMDAAANLKKDLSEAQTVLRENAGAILFAANVGADGNITRKAVEIKSGIGFWESIKIFLNYECR